VADVEPALDRLLRRQHGVLTRAQAVQHRMRRGALDHAGQYPGLYRIHPRVYSLAPPPLDGLAKFIAALLYAGSGAVLSRFSAAALWRLPVPPDALVHLLLPDRRRVRGQAGLSVHRTSTLEAAEIRRVDQLPVTSIERTVTDLAAVQPARQTLSLVAELLRSGRTRESRLLQGVAGHHRLPGAAALVAALRQLAGGLESPLEVDALHRLIRTAGLPEPVAQLVVRHDGCFVARVDFGWPETKIALEVDGRVAHVSVAAFERDAARELALQAAGWTVVRITARLLHKEPATAVAAIVAAMAGRGLRT